MLEYTLEWLVSSEVDEIFVFCSSHAQQVNLHLISKRSVDFSFSGPFPPLFFYWGVFFSTQKKKKKKIEDFIESSKWKKQQLYSRIVIEILTSANCYSAGDVLREIDLRGRIKSDFILVSGDVVSNVDLKK